MPSVDDYDKRVVIYPAYINSKNPVSRGRRIPVTQACENPNVIEIADCCNKGLNLRAEYELKSYPREWWVKGRVRVQLKNDDGSLCNPAIPDRKTLFAKVAELVPRHPGRSEKAKKAAAELAAKEKAEREKAAGASSSGARPAAKSGKKKGRK